MCYQVQCPRCHKTTWDGCGQHAEEVMASVPTEQISAAMKTSIGNVGYLIHHGVAALRTKWQAMENEEPAPGKARSPALAAA